MPMTLVGIRIKKNIIKIMALSFVLLLLFASLGYAKVGKTVYLLDIEGIIDGGMAAYIDRAYTQAEKENAEMIILEIDTPGGLLQAAKDMRRTIKDSPIPTVAFVRGGAISAGVLIALSAQEIYMSPGTTIGDAEPRIGRDRADEKTISYWSSLLATAAEERGRNGEIARAMADQDVVIPDLKEKGKLLTLTDKEALKLGFAEGSAANIRVLMDQLSMEDAEIKTVPMDISEKLTRFVTNPYVAPLLLTVGFVGLATEVLTVGFGVAGLISFIAFLLYFWGHLFAGLSSWGVVLLFIGGIILILLEVLVIPGFGVVGIGGLLAILASVIMASGSVQQGVISLLLAFLGTSLAIYLSFKFGRTRKLWQRLILNVKLDTESGYVASESTLGELVGKKGIALTPLRPAGAVQIEGHRHDVVTEGNFIPKNRAVQVVKVEGSRVVVEEISKEKGD
jgi:membrane-bound serine protease (ClpP class)